MLVLLVCIPSQAATLKATIGDYNSTDSMYQMELSDTTFTFAPSDTLVLPKTVTVPAGSVITYGATSSVLAPYRIVTAANDVIQTTDSGKYIVSTNQTGTKFWLPAAAPGLYFTIIGSGLKTSGMLALDYITVDVAAVNTDTILAAYSSITLDTGDSIKSSGQTGDSVCVMSTVAGYWNLCGQRGTWSDNSTN